MAKRFSTVNVNDETLFLRGFVEPTDLSKSDLFLDILAGFSSFEQVEIEIEHCLLLDYPGNDEDISVEDLETVVDNFETLIDEGHLFSEELLYFKTYGIKEDEFIEE